MKKHNKKLLRYGLFEIGDKIVADEHLKGEYGIDHVQITGVNYDTKVYYWQAELFDGGLMLSGTPFDCAEKFNQ